MGVNIDIYLRNAFKELDAFSIPGLGTFRKVHLSAALDEEENLVHPPRVEIEFSPQVDTRLSFVRYLTQQVQIPPEEAEKIVADISEDIKGQVREEGNFDMPEIGVLYGDGKGSYAFSPYEDSRDAFSSEFFGLPPIDLNSHGEVGEYFSPVEPEDKSMTQPKPAQPSERNRRPGFSALTLILVFLILGTAGIFVWQNQALTRSSLLDKNYLSITGSSSEGSEMLADNQAFEEFEVPESQPAANAEARRQGDGEKPDAGPASSSSQENTTSSPSSKPSSPRLEETPPFTNSRALEPMGLPRGGGNQEEEGSMETFNSANARLSQAQSSYHLIAGSFAKPTLAERFKKQLLEEGYKKVEILPSPEIGKYRVSIFQSQNLQEVKIFQSNLKEQGRRKGWILENK